MFSFHKKLLIFFAAFQLITVQVIAERTSHIIYTYAWTGSGVTKALNDELDLVQKQAYNESKLFELVEISIIPARDWVSAYVLYNLSESTGKTNPLITQVAFASAWTESGIAENLQDEINSLQDFAFNENKLINILDIKIIAELNHAYIVYEISK